MNIRNISNKIKQLNIGPIGSISSSSILIPIIEIDGELEIIYQLRSNNLNTQPGEISFPGGGAEPQDNSYEETAIRETMEELNIARDNINILGEMNFLVSKNGYLINCYVGEIVNVDFENINPNPDEVDHLFTVPLKYLLATRPEKYELDLKRTFPENFPFDRIPSGSRYKWREYKDTIYFYNYGTYNIWGWTARITKDFIDIIK